jgi:putative membrane protein
MNRKQKTPGRKRLNKPKWLALILISCALIAFSPFYPVEAGNDITESDKNVKLEPDNQSNYTDKDETVYASLHPDGNVRNISVVNYLRPDSSPISGPVIDYGDFTDIRPLSAHVEYETHGKEIHFFLPNLDDGFYYQGTLNKGELPFLLDIQYSLNGEIVSPQDVVGKSGILDLTLAVRPNLHAAKYYQENYICQLQIALPVDRYTDIKAPLAQRFLTGKSLTLSYIVMPGQDALFQITSLVNLLETPQMTLTSVPFSMEAFLGLDPLFSSDELLQLSEGMRLLIEGTHQVRTGLESLQTALYTVNSSYSDILSGQKKSLEGMIAYQSGVTDLSSNLSMLTSIMSEMSKQGESLGNGLLALQSGTEEIFAGFSPLIDEMEEPQKTLYLTQIEELKQYFALYVSSLQEYTSAVTQLSASYHELSSGADQLDLSGDILVDGMNEIIDGGSLFGEGLNEITMQSVALPKGLDQVIQGQSELNRQFSTAIDLIKPFMPEPLESRPVSFSDSEREVHSVQIVMSVSALLVSDPIAPEPTEPIQKNFWQRFLDLFRLFR